MEPAYSDENLTRVYFINSANPDFKEYFVTYGKFYVKEDIGEQCDIDMSDDYLEESIILGGIKEYGEKIQFIRIEKKVLDYKPDIDLKEYHPMPIDLIDRLNNLPKHIRNLLNSKKVLLEDKIH